MFGTFNMVSFTLRVSTSVDIQCKMLLLSTVLCLALIHGSVGQIGMYCSKNSDCKMSSSFVCSTKKQCECDRGFRYDTLKTNCVRSMVPIGQRCDPDRDTCLGGPNSVCDSLFLGERPTCQCKPGFQYHGPTKLCQTPEFIESYRPETDQGPGSGSGTSGQGSRPGGPCKQNSDCYGYPNATCYYYVNSNVHQCNCTFDSHYYSPSFDNCLPKKPMGSTCDTLDECLNIANIECSRSSGQTIKHCRCKPAFYFDAKEKKCLPKLGIGEPCEEDEQCRVHPNSYCQKAAGGSSKSPTKRCACLPQKLYYRGAGTCVDAHGPIPQGKPCITASQCEGGQFAACSNLFLGQSPVCRCQEGYSFDQHSKLCTKGGSGSGGGISCRDAEFNVDGTPTSNSCVPEDPPGAENQPGNRHLDFKLRVKMVCSGNDDCKVVSASAVPE